MILASTVVAQGTTPPIVLLHSLALDQSVWAPLVSAIEDERMVITVDLRGHGKSPKDDSFSIEDIADDVAATMAHLDHDRAIIVGLSMGGCVAQAVATRHADLVTGLGLIDTTAWYGPDAPQRWAERAIKAQEQGMTSLSQFQIDRWFGDEFIKEHRNQAERLLKVFADNDIDSYVAACHAMGQFDAREAIGSIMVPTIVIVGELDPATSPTHARDISSRIPGSVLHVIPGAKHLTPVERPSEVAALLRPLWTDDATQRSRREMTKPQDESTRGGSSADH